jgi:dolichol-phosphate mannosyltransferase
MQDPPELIPELVAQWRAGGEVIYAQRIARHGETLFKRATAAGFYRLLRLLTALDIPADVGDFRLLDRRVVDALGRIRERRRFLRGLTAWVGFRQVAVPYERQERYAGSTKYPLTRMLALASDAIIGFSDAPLRLAGIVGLGLLGLGALGVVVCAALGLLGALSSFAALVTALVALGFIGIGLQLSFLGALGLYVVALTDEARGRPLYLLSEVAEGRSVAESSLYSGKESTLHIDETPMESQAMYIAPRSLSV